MKRYLLAVAAFFSLFWPSHAENYGYIPDATIYLGSGFDPLYPQRTFPQCIASTAECQLGALGANVCLSTNSQQQSEPDHKFGVATTFSIKQISSKYEFFKEVNISLALSGSYGPFSAAGSFSSFSMDEVKEDSLTWMVTAKSHYGSFGMQQPKLNDEAAKIKQPLDLIAKCGVGYVSQVDRGVIAAAVFSIYNLDEKHRSEIRASLSAGFSAGFSASGSASYSEIVRQAMQYGSMSIRVYTVGGEGTPGLANLVIDDPTNLTDIKKTLSDYVSKQDKTRAAIIGFRTTGFGKLIGNASIDPDQSNYAYFLEMANGFRLKLLDGLTRVETLLENQADYDDDAVERSKDLRDGLGCELRYVETQIQACRLSYDVVRTAMTDGVSNNDRAALLSLNYGMQSNEQSGIKICSPPTRLSTLNAATSSVNFTPMGWSIAADLAEGASDAPDETKAIATSCKTRIDKAQALYQTMLASASKREGLCVAGCELITNPNLLQKVKQLPGLPFEIEYWFDDGAATFGATHNPGVYFIVRGASKIAKISFFDDTAHAPGTPRKPFAVNSYKSIETISEFLPLAKFTSDSVTLEFQTQSNNVYQYTIPKTSPL
ncbi:hypothetical protein HB780_14590 [Rhizobium lusitanum]|uniref:hypothetical protein n=1 Tax=Rhizobium lusitanum TaxID=293958 RepID=UPI001609BE09|nr:hypothetical protein [Rhizobium lusitanum]QND46964.1 hypothetical protein HB780_14590 [Rhizobium lusitanum]